MSPHNCHCFCKPRHCAGFTLLEAVLTLLLIGMLSAAASGLYADKDVFSGRVLADRLASQLLAAQQLALARGLQGEVTVALTLTGPALLMRVSQGALQTDSSVPADGLAVGWTQSATGNCGTVLQNLPLVLRYQPDGTLLTPAGGGRSVLVCVDSRYPVCVTAEGHAHAGTCF
jgi:type II secretory pathway pseudopilin PulG